MMKRLLSMNILFISTLAIANCSDRSCCSEKSKAVKTETKAPRQPRKEDKKMARTKTLSGLEYEVQKEGSGDSPKQGKKVTVHYTGWLDKNGQPGSKFDSSVDRGQPFTFTIGIGQVIRGWDEGVKDMKIGEKRRLYVPAQLGYGTRGAGNVIPPNADLIFDVELISVE